MSLAVITGSAGLVGSEAARFFCGQGWDVVGIDNDMRSHFFGAEASTAANRARLEAELPAYHHLAADIRDRDAIETLFAKYGTAIGAVIHAASQPSHNWAADDPHTDFAVNALGTLNLLEATRRHAPEAAFVFVSTNKVYGDRPNQLPLIEQETRFAVSPEHPFAARGIDETMGIDRTLHSLFGASKTAADVMVQEYGRYFGMATVCFRGGCLSGPAHSGAELHGFLAFLVRSCVEGRAYRVFGHKAKQVRDNLHARDLVEAFWHYVRRPRPGEVYNIGARKGDHIWWVSDVGKFQAHYPDWRVERDVAAIVGEIADALGARR